MAVATFASLRFGEVTALRRMDVDLVRGSVTVRQAFTELPGQGLVGGPPKSRAGLRTVSLPGGVVAELRDYMDKFVSPEPTALVFIGAKGVAMRRSSFNPPRGLDEGGRGHRRTGAALPRPAAHGEHPRGRDRREHS
jgi:integrase